MQKSAKWKILIICLTTQCTEHNFAHNISVRFHQNLVVYVGVAQTSVCQAWTKSFFVVDNIIILMYRKNQAQSYFSLIYLKQYVSTLLYVRSIFHFHVSLSDTVYTNLCYRSPLIKDHL